MISGIVIFLLLFARWALGFTLFPSSVYVLGGNGWARVLAVKTLIVVKPLE